VGIHQYQIGINMYTPIIDTKSKRIKLTTKNTLQAAVKARNKYIANHFPKQDDKNPTDTTTSLEQLLHYKSKEAAQKFINNGYYINKS